jgi:hypothetical protein
VFGRELFDDTNLLLPERLLGRANACEVVIIHNAKTARLDSLVDSLRQSIFEIAHADKLPESFSLAYVT